MCTCGAVVRGLKRGKTKQNNAIFLPKREERMSVEDKAVLVLAVLGLSSLSSLSFIPVSYLNSLPVLANLAKDQKIRVI